MAQKRESISCYAAPMEGVTGYIYRNAHHRYFGGVEKYFTPFLTPKPKRGWNSREKNDILPEHNRDIPVVPQILTNRAEDFIRISEKLRDYGYSEVNLNLGCPSGTVVAKGKGSAFLADREGLKHFFEDVFAKKMFLEGEMKVSVKTRLGMEKPEEIRDLIQIYNQFPLSEVILHARVRSDYYKKPVNLRAFGEALSICRHSLCYNGDIFTKKDCRAFQKKFPDVSRVMTGRGLIANPELAEEIVGMPCGLCKKNIYVAREEELPGESSRRKALKNIEAEAESGGRDYKRWQEFLTEVCAGYGEVMSGERNVLFKMKEIWSHMILSFPGKEKYGKKIKKAKNLAEYKAAAGALFREI